MKRVWHKDYKKWLEWRMGGIGGSDAPAIMGASKWCSIDECWARKLELMLPQPMTYPMRRGIKLEPIARKSYEAKIGIRMPRANFRSIKHPWALVSLDGFNEKYWHVAEYKCPGKEDHAIAKSGKIPEHYIWQLVHIAMVMEADTVDYVSHKDDETIVVPFHRNPEMEKRLIEAEKKFWRCVVDGTRPSGRKQAPERPKNVVEFPKPFEFKTRRSRK